MSEQKKDIEFLKTFGQRIKELRKQKGLTQEKLADLTDLVDVDIRRIEAGSLNTGLTRIKALADGFGISVSELFRFKSV